MDTLIEIVGEMQPIPEGIDFLGEELYQVPWDMLELLDDDDDFDWDSDCLEQEDQAIQITNPRRYDGHGFDQQSMFDLYRSLISNGQVCPFLVRWRRRDDGTVFLQILDGERRYRNTKRLKQQNEMCWSRKAGKKLPASEVFQKITCKCINATDEEAISLMNAVSMTNVAWGEGATAKLIWKMRHKFHFSDEKILEKTGKSEQWLREQDKICQLRIDGDTKTFLYLCEDKINRALCLQLCKIKDVKKRHYYLDQCYEDAISRRDEEVAEADSALDRAEQKEEIAEGQLAEAQEKNDPEAIQEAQQQLEDARQKSEEKRDERQQADKPRGKTSSLRRVAEREQERTEGGEEDVRSPLRAKKVEELYLRPIQELIKSKGVLESTGKKILEDEECFVLRYVERVLDGQLKGIKDVMGILKRTKEALVIERKRKK
jgi:ParB-like nuclease domain